MSLIKARTGYYNDIISKLKKIYLDHVGLTAYRYIVFYIYYFNVFSP